MYTGAVPAAGAEDVLAYSTMASYRSHQRGAVSGRVI
jgi:hypothetical protein